jgi:hypothetical protein
MNEQRRDEEELTEIGGDNSPTNEKAGNETVEIVPAGAMEQDPPDEVGETAQVSEPMELAIPATAAEAALDVSLPPLRLPEGGPDDDAGASSVALLGGSAADPRPEVAAIDSLSVEVLTQSNSPSQFDVDELLIEHARPGEVREASTPVATEPKGATRERLFTADELRSRSIAIGGGRHTVQRRLEIEVEVTVANMQRLSLVAVEAAKPEFRKMADSAVYKLRQDFRDFRDSYRAIWGR